MYSVVLMVAERIGEGEIRELAQVLGLPVISARRLYDFGGPRGGHDASTGTPTGLGPVAA